MTSLSSLRFRLVGTVFLAVAPASVLLYFGNKYYASHYGAQLPWTEFLVGLLALGAAWFGGERFIIRQVRVLSLAARKLGAGDLTSRTGLSRERGELGELSRTFDSMAAQLEEREKESERVKRTLTHRTMQQTAVAALGRFALETSDPSILLNHAATLAAQTLDVEFCHVLEVQPGGKFLLMRAGVGWKDGEVGKVVIPADPQTETGFALTAKEAVAFASLGNEGRFRGSSLLTNHKVVSGVTVAIAGQEQAFGVLGAYTKRPRTFTEDEVHFLFSIATVLAMAVERIRVETELQKLAAFAQLNPNPALELTSDGAITYFNNAALKLSRSVGRDHPRELLPDNVQEIVQNCLKAGRSVLDLSTVLEKRSLSWSFHPVAASHIVHCYVEDITDRLNLEAQLRQSQKMESIGQLAAGVAHDFNNMLTVIQGHSGMVMANTDLAPALLDSAQAIYFAAERAATLTRQLLLFSRKNVMQPKALDLRNVVGDLSKMLKRLLGETVALQFNPPAELPLVAADAGMLEQVIVNLAVNARDAMPKGGTLTIRTTPVMLNEAFVQMHPRPGPARSSAWRSTTRDAEWTWRQWPASSSPSLPPRKSAKGRAWDWPPSMASSSSTKAGSRSAAKSEKARPSSSICPPATSRPRRGRPGRPKRPPCGAATKPSLLWKTRSCCATWRNSFCTIAATGCWWPARAPKPCKPGNGRRAA